MQFHQYLVSHLVCYHFVECTVQLFDVALIFARLDEGSEKLKEHWVCFAALFVVLLEFGCQKENIFVEHVHICNAAVVLFPQDLTGLGVAEFGTSHQRHLFVVVSGSQGCSIGHKQSH